MVPSNCRVRYEENKKKGSLDNVDSKHSGRPEKEKQLGCLCKWKARVGAQATFKVIVQAVLLSGSIANAEAICQHPTETRYA